MPDVNWHVETIDSWVSAGIRQVVPMKDITQAFDKGFGDVAAALGAAGLVPAGPAYARYYGMPTEVVDVEIGFGIHAPADAPGLTVTEHPATSAVVGTHIGPYDELRISYDTLPGWLVEHPTELSQNMFEFYDSDPGADPPTTRMVFPLA